MDDAAHRISGSELVRRVTRYTTIENDTARDTRLSWTALGILVNLLSHVDGWRIRNDDFVRPHHGSGREAVARAMRDLVELGYLERTNVRDHRGRLRAVTILHYPPRDMSAAPAPDVQADAGSLPFV